MGGLNTKVSENLHVEDSYMRYRDGSLTFTSSSIGIFFIMGILMENVGHDIHDILYALIFY